MVLNVKSKVENPKRGTVLGFPVLSIADIRRIAGQGHSNAVVAATIINPEGQKITD